MMLVPAMRGQPTTCGHDPGPRVEPDPVSARVRCEGLSQARERSFRRCRPGPRQHLPRAREVPSPFERRRDVPTVVDGPVDVGEDDVRESCRAQDPVWSEAVPRFSRSRLFDSRPVEAWRDGRSHGTLPFYLRTPFLALGG
jgi:hypothetical protein